MSIKALSGKVFLLITGASRGIGREIATSLGSILQEGSHALLLATNLNGLKETAKKISNKNIVVDTVSIDLSKATKEELHDVVLKSLKDTTPDKFDRVVVVHNVGSIGDVTQCASDMTDSRTWHSYFDLNVFIPAILNGVIMEIFNQDTQTQKMIINITSLFSMQPGRRTGYYCTGKAAREMFFKVFALENPDVNVLNYSPGPVDTDMFHIICEDITDKETKEQFNDMLTKKTVLTTEQTVKRLLAILKDQKYNSGDHVDYYDEL